MKIHRRFATATRRRGFTLIELMAVMLIISILMVYLVPKIPEWIDRAEVTACKKNLQEIYTGLNLYQMKHERIPSDPGARFFAILVAKDVWENTPASAKKLTCPGVDVGALPGIADKEPTEWFIDLELVDGDCTAYAGRDTKEYPLRKLQIGKEPLVCDDNDGGKNHRTTTNVLYGDGSVGSFELADEREKGNILPEEEIVVVGPESKNEVLRKFSLK